jgi:hypothetical protein
MATRVVSIMFSGTRAASTAAPVVRTPAPASTIIASAAASGPTASTTALVAISHAVPVSIISPAIHPAICPTTVTVFTSTVVGESIIIHDLKVMMSITGPIAASCLGVLPLALHVPVHNAHEVRGEIPDVTPRAAIYFINGIEGIFLGKHSHSIFYFQVKIAFGAESTCNECIQPNLERGGRFVVRIML